MTFRVGALLIAGCFMGCSSPEACEGSECSAVSTCRTDEECNDGLACNGEETCEGGNCVEGEPVECELYLVCAEADGSASCEFEEASPWYVYIGDDLGAEPLRLFAVREFDLGRAAPIDLTAEVANEGVLGPTFYSWSPGGRFLVFDLADAEFRSRLFVSEFGTGLPTPGVPLPDLPVHDNWWPILDWSAGDETAVIHDATNAYLVDFRNGLETRLLEPAAGELSSMQPCADGDSLVYQTESGAFIAGLPSLEDATLLGERASVSPDGTRLVAFAADGVWTQECGLDRDRQRQDTPAADGESTDLGWSANSRFYALATLAEDETSSSSTIVDAVGGEVPWTAGISSLSDEWSDEGARLLFRTSSGWALATFPGGETTDLGLPADTPSAELHAAGVSYRNDGETSEDSREWLRLNDWSSPMELEECGTSLPSYDDGPTHAVCVSQADAQWSFVVFTFDANGISSKVRLDEPVSAELSVEEFSPDGRGVIAKRTMTTNEARQKILWIPSPFTEDAPIVEVNSGTLAYGGSWQPFPLASAKAR